MTDEKIQSSENFGYLPPVPQNSLSVEAQEKLRRTERNKKYYEKHKEKLCENQRVKYAQQVDALYSSFSNNIDPVVVDQILTFVYNRLVSLPPKQRDLTNLSQENFRKLFS